MTTDNFCCYLQNRLIRTSQTGGQQYSDTSPFSIPCPRWCHFSPASVPPKWHHFLFAPGMTYLFTNIIFAAANVIIWLFHFNLYYFSLFRYEAACLNTEATFLTLFTKMCNNYLAVFLPNFLTLGFIIFTNFWLSYLTLFSPNFQIIIWQTDLQNFSNCILTCWKVTPFHSDRKKYLKLWNNLACRESEQI
jgi:hypothetical protein